MRSRPSKSKIRKDLLKAGNVEQRNSLHRMYDSYYQSATPEQKHNADILLEYGNGLFSKEEIIDIVWGRKGAVRLLLPTIWFRPKEILEQSDALIYLIRIVTGKKCDGSEKIELNGRDLDLISYAFAEGIHSENVRSEKKRSLIECQKYARRRVKDLLNKCTELNGNEKYVPGNLGSRVGQGSQDPQVRELNKLLRSAQMGAANRAEIQSQIETLQSEKIQEKQHEQIDFSLIPSELLRKLGLNPDGSRKKKSA